MFLINQDSVYLEIIVMKISTVIQNKLSWDVTILLNIWIYTQRRYACKLKWNVCFNIFLCVLHSHFNCCPKILGHSEKEKKILHKEDSYKRLYSLNPWKSSLKIMTKVISNLFCDLTASSTGLDQVSSRSPFQSDLCYNILFCNSMYYLQNYSPKCRKSYSY